MGCLMRTRECRHQIRLLAKPQRRVKSSTARKTSARHWAVRHDPHRTLAWTVAEWRVRQMLHRQPPQRQWAGCPHQTALSGPRRQESYARPFAQTQRCQPACRQPHQQLCTEQKATSGQVKHCHHVSLYTCTYEASLCMGNTSTQAQHNLHHPSPRWSDQHLLNTQFRVNC